MCFECPVALRAVLLTFRELPKIFSRKYTTPDITFMVRISIWKLVRVPKAHIQSFSLKFSSVLFVQYTNFGERIFWWAREALVKQPPVDTIHGVNHAFPVSYYHDDVIKWKHFPFYWPFVRGIHRSPVNSLQKGQWRGALCLLWAAPE